MPGKKLSGAAGRKRKKEAEKTSKQSSSFLVSFFKKAKVKEAESEDYNSSESEDGGSEHQQLVSEHENDGYDTVDRVEPYEDHNTEQSMVQTDATDCATEDVAVEQVQQDDELGGSDGDAAIEESSVEEADNVVPAAGLLRFHDVGYLEFDETTRLSIISQPLRDEMISLGSGSFQHRDSLPPPITGERSITSAWFKRRLANGVEVNRSWLLYSPINGATYCFCCLLFTSSNSNSRSSFELANGFNKWKKPEKLLSHENSPSHRTSFTTWKEAERRIIDGTGIDAEVQAQIQLEKQRWRDILQRILTCIKFLVSQNLALRGHEENLRAAEDRNVGNFLSVIKLVAQYDPLLSKHLQHGRENPGSVSYLSPEIQNEFIHILALTVRNQLLSEIRKNKYYGILFDSTPDLAPVA